MFLTYIRARKETLFSGLIDLSLFVILYFNEIESKLDLNLKLNLTYFCLSIIWILISYVCGRYSINNKYNYEKIISIFTKFLLCLFITFSCIAFGKFFIAISKMR